MHTNNPYAQAGWHNPANPLAYSQRHSTSATTPPTFGALPAASNALPTILEFKFTSYNPDIMNCLVYGPRNAQYFTISTDDTFPDTTTISKQGSQVVAVIEWHRHPIVEVKGQIPKQRAAQWMPLSENQSSREMNVNGKQFAWVPQGSSLQLFGTGTTSAQQYAKLIRGAQSLTLQLSTEAIQTGILEASVVAALLLQSGRHID
ncbi:hypothetical protein BDQ12DRAFT_756510 [Crucibulum laeve]|uniref:DUF6593 domain-containing protein n=1 Tax=Crucibulum laeve TaxID=68775 RepID=A0A5C3LSP3_9AGAR|nr:hypothetical protein BDQ12DRAFT_756510 [Crucibulum laeve]